MGRDPRKVLAAEAIQLGSEESRARASAISLGVSSPQTARSSRRASTLSTLRPASSDHATDSLVTAAMEGAESSHLSETHRNTAIRPRLMATIQPAASL